MGGYSGRILSIDLTSGHAEAKPLDMEFAREYIGGLGFGTKIYLDLIKGKPDANGPGMIVQSTVERTLTTKMTYPK